MSHPEKSITVHGLYQHILATLRHVTHADAVKEAADILSWYAGIEEQAIITAPDTVVDMDALLKIETCLKKRLSGIPLAYILGHQFFFGRPFTVTTDTLIPRQETEELVALAITEAKKRTGPLKIVDLGTGTGCIIITLYKELGNDMHQYVGVDVSPTALDVARKNAKALQATRCDFQAITSPVELIHTDILVANLPYVPHAKLTEPSIAHEPRLALDGGVDGAGIIQTYLDQLPNILNAHGVAMFEIDDEHTLSSFTFPKNYSYEIRPDLSGRNRFLVVRPC